MTALEKPSLSSADFQFPFTPYPEQLSFMQTLYDGLENGKVLIMESPTGTGKSMSLICGALKWLRDFKEKNGIQNHINPVNDHSERPTEPDWVLEHAKLQVQQNQQNKKEKQHARAIRLMEIRKAEHEQQSSHLNKRRRNLPVAVDHDSDEDGYLIDDYHSSEESGCSSTNVVCAVKTDHEDLEDAMGPRLFYCSRTHSQISQFVNEIKKTAYTDCKVVSLGSRKTLCINKSVQRLGSLAKINDKCLDLMKAPSSGKTKCDYLNHDPIAQEGFTDHLHAIIRDIEEIVQLGEKRHFCPYFGTRGALNSSDLERATIQLQNYLAKFKRRLKGKNVSYISQLLILIKALQKPLDKAKRCGGSSIMTTNEFVHELDIDHINVFKIQRYLRESRLPQKLQGFAEKVERAKRADITDHDEDFVPKHSSPMHAIEAFLMSLTNAELEGRIVLSQTSELCANFTLKYLLLNPANAFRTVVEEARAVVLAGGTMEPITELGRAIANLCNVTPAGIVCFFPSYDFVDLIYRRWGEQGILQHISSRKKLFKEPRESTQVEHVLGDYSRCVDENGANRGKLTGAILFAVVGGKMSEGINFSDGLARLVIMIGLPFPNMKSPELKEKLKYINSLAVSRGSNGSTAATSYYENLCMKASHQASQRLRGYHSSRPPIHFTQNKKQASEVDT
ncbi:DEAD H (Asp-Glu-Ala-Asp His) box helicase 11 [Gaertneriomyces sp. JEL0708]|nr:DEAD H (Asp-Glu-Ala-Asp His) box helicase 11 [Gaertneriomyces sp. JEL0708]